MPGIGKRNPGRKLPLDVAEFSKQKREYQNAPLPESEPVQADISIVRYGAAYNSTANTPSGQNDGIQGPGGRLYAEVISLTAAAGSPGIAVSLHAGSKGVRALVELSSSTIATGDVRWWVQDPSSLKWYATPVVDTLVTGVAAVATPEQLLSVGAK